MTTPTLITKSNLFSESWNNIYNLINSKTNVADPTISSSEFRKWVFSREPDVKAAEFSGYPYIVVNNSEVDVDTKGKGRSVDGKSQIVTWTIEIDVVTSDRGHNDQDGKGQVHMDAISDDIMETLMSITNRNTIKANGLYFPSVKPTGVVQEAKSNELCFRRSFILGFLNKMQVSA
jgi:hypothetical protein